MPAAKRGEFDIYAQQRIIQKLDDLCRARPGLSLSGIAASISEERGIEFHRVNFTRLRTYNLSDPLIEVVVEWIVRHHDPNFRRKLAPEGIFADVGESSRDFYFHLSQMDRYETWEADVLNAFEGAYLCAPAGDLNSYIPSPVVRDLFERVVRNEAAPEERRSRSLDIRQYIGERSVLVLKATPAGYYHAAEFPYALLFPPSFDTLDARMVHEGVGIASGNSIRVFLRECLSRVGKSHSILIAPKGPNEAANPQGLSIFTAGPVRQLAREYWSTLADLGLRHMREEFAGVINLDYALTGTAQIEVSPIPDLKNRIETTFSRDYVYHRKPSDFLRHPRVHFIRPDLARAEEFERIIKNPLAVGQLQ